MASDDVQKNGEHCLREGKRCEPELKNLIMRFEERYIFRRNLCINALEELLPVTVVSH